MSVLSGGDHISCCWKSQYDQTPRRLVIQERPMDFIKDLALLWDGFGLGGSCF
jgi:hypothetical protein